MIDQTSRPVSLATEFPPASREQWRRLVDDVLKGAPFERLVSVTYDGLHIEPLYARDADARPLAMRAAAPWRVMQRVDHPDPAVANAMALHDLENGATGLDLVFAGSAGAYGFGVDAKETALARVLDGVHLDAGIRIVLELGGGTKGVPDVLAKFLGDLRIDPGSVDIAMNFDPLGALAFTGATGAHLSQLVPQLAIMAKTLAAQSFRGPFALADGRIVHNAGGTEAQELAFVLAVAVAYLRAFEAAGVALDQARGWISFKLSADADQFLTMAKFRGLRELWARVEQACGLAPRAAHVAAETAWRMMTRRDPHANMLRATVAAAAAGLGGADAVTVLPFTLARGLPDIVARRIARNTQLVLIEEAHLAKVVDPAAGAGAIGALTGQLCSAAWSLFQDIERVGGAAVAIEAGFIRDKVTATLGERRRNIALGTDALVGTNLFADLHEAPETVLKSRSSEPVRHSGTALAAVRLAEPFERLRDASDEMLETTGARPSAFLALLGPPADAAPRAAFARGFFEAGGIETVGPGQNAVFDLAFKHSRAKLACLCGTDAEYARRGPDAVAALKAAGAVHVYVVGDPHGQFGKLAAADVTFIREGCDALTTLQAAHRLLGLDP